MFFRITCRMKRHEYAQRITGISWCTNREWNRSVRSTWRKKPCTDRMVVTWICRIFEGDIGRSNSIWCKVGNATIDNPVATCITIDDRIKNSTITASDIYRIPADHWITNASILSQPRSPDLTVLYTCVGNVTSPIGINGSSGFPDQYTERCCLFCQRFSPPNTSQLVVKRHGATRGQYAYTMPSINIGSKSLLGYFITARIGFRLHLDDFSYIHTITRITTRYLNTIHCVNSTTERCRINFRIRFVPRQIITEILICKISTTQGEHKGAALSG